MVGPRKSRKKAKLKPLAIVDGRAYAIRGGVKVYGPAPRPRGGNGTGERTVKDGTGGSDLGAGPDG